MGSWSLWSSLGMIFKVWHWIFVFNLTSQNRPLTVRNCVSRAESDLKSLLELRNYFIWIGAFFINNTHKRIAPLNFNHDLWLVDLWRSRWFQPLTKGLLFTLGNPRDVMSTKECNWCLEITRSWSVRNKIVSIILQQQYTSCSVKRSKNWHDSLIACAMITRKICLLSILGNY